jgi:gliding motility-associated-like protein
MTSAITSADTLLKCFGDNNGFITITVIGGGTPPYSYLWNSGQNTSAITNLTGGLYTITITDHNGCNNIRSVPIDQPSELYLLAGSHASQCSDSCSGEATSAVTGGTPFHSGNYTYLWNNGQTTENINSLCPGIYYLTVTDSNGCQKSDSATVGKGVNINSGFTASPSTGYSPLTVNFAASSTTSSNIYFWTFGDGNIDTTGGNPTHIYNYHSDTTFKVCLLVIDSNCKSSNCQLINVEIHSKIVAPNVFTPNGDGKNDEFVVQDTSIATFSCIIFNRWGRKIYEWSDVNKGWDGKTSSGADAPDGTYYYIITAKGYDNINYNLHGAVMLLR